MSPIRTLAWISLATLSLGSCWFQPKEHLVLVQLPIPTIQSLDPFKWNAQSVLAQGTLYEGLFGFDAQGQIVPKLAQSYTTSADRRIWTIHLKKGLKWSDGSELSAKDFMYSWMRQLKPGQPAEVWASFMLDVENAIDYKSGSLSADRVGIKLLDSHTLEIHLKFGMDLRPKLALATAVPLNEKSVLKAESLKSNFWDPQYFVGNGPYIPRRLVKDQFIELEPNPYYQGPRGNVDRFMLKMGGEQVEVQSYEAQDLDLALVTGMGDYKYVNESPHLHGQVFSLEKLGFHGFQIARTIHPLMEDLNLRKALAFAVDRQTIANAVLGGRVLPTSFYGPPSDSLLKDLHTYEYNIDSARYYLSKSNYPTTLELNQRPKLSFFAPPANEYKWSGVIEALQAAWTSIGINVEIENMENLILDQYTWGGGYRRDPNFARPGITMYTGEMLWPNAIMQMRLADHTWYYQNFPLALKYLLRDKTLESDVFALSGKGNKNTDWKMLDTLAEQLIKAQNEVLANETNAALREELSFPNYKTTYARIRSLWTQSQNDKEQRALWLRARQLINDGQIALLKWTNNEPNRQGWRLMAELYRTSLSESKAPIQALQQMALDQAWIVPIYSEKLVYLKRPWIEGEMINRYGKHLMAFNLQYIKVDTALYWKEH